MNYRHAFHAGNPGDVLKHVVLLAIMRALQAKPTAISVLDTHAGRGLYALDDEEARRTREAGSGIGRLLPRRGGRPAAPRETDPRPAPLPGIEGRHAAIQRYLDAITACRSQHGPSAYPGSPWLLSHALREDDRLACCELQPDEAAALKSLFSSNPRVAVHERDGYQAMRALLPPTPRRGLVLIDPPYETQLAEFDTALAALAVALERWPQGVYMLWYPIKQRRLLQTFYRAASRLPAKTSFTAELLVRYDDSPLRMNGSGVLVINPPWRLDQDLKPALAQLVPLLDAGGGSSSVNWLQRE